jgi:hypothetical protein
MAKLKDDAITAKDMEEFVGSNSDFAFEMHVLAQLRALGFECAHSGTYRDPVTDKIRQFDIRAVKHQGNSTLALAVECKNLRPNNPLLLSAVPRTPSESFHDLLVWKGSGYHRYPSVRPIAGHDSAYKPDDMVGKKPDQVGRDTSGALVSNDEPTFDKLSQAVNSCRDLVRDFAPKPDEPPVRAVVPILVVPEGLLWQADYDRDGRLAEGPRAVAHTTLFLNNTWLVETGLNPIPCRQSHIEFVTLGALPEIVHAYFGPGGFFTTVRE